MQRGFGEACSASARAAALAAVAVALLGPEAPFAWSLPMKWRSWTLPGVRPHNTWYTGDVLLASHRWRLMRHAQTEPSVQKLIDMMPSEPGTSNEQVGFEQLCTRWNREEAEAVDRSKRTLQSPNTTREAKMRGIHELEYWAIRRGGYDAEIVLIGALKSPDRELAGQAHMSLKKTWANHFNAWVNNAICHGNAMVNQGRVLEAMPIFDKVVFQNPLWGEGYHLRAKCWNQLKDVEKTIADLRKALEFCPNNYLVMVELAITLMDKRQEYEEAAQLMKNAADLCPILPIEAFTESLYEKAPHLKARDEAEKAASQFSLEAPPSRLMPDAWVDRYEATERPNQAFLRVGAELEQWFTQLRLKDAPRTTQRKLWSKLVIAWDPDKHPRQLRSFTTQVHEALKARRERELAKAEDEDTLPTAYEVEDDEDAVAFLRRMRLERRRKQETSAA